MWIYKILISCVIIIVLMIILDLWFFIEINSDIWYYMLNRKVFLFKEKYDSVSNV